MKELHLLKNLLKEGDLMCKLDLKDAYFCIPLSKHSGKFVRFYWEGIPYESCISYLYKPVENPNSYFQNNQYTSNNIFERYADHGEYNEGNCNESRYYYLPFTDPRVCGKLEKVTTYSLSKDRMIFMLGQNIR